MEILRFCLKLLKNYTLKKISDNVKECKLLGTYEISFYFCISNTN